MVTAAPDLYKAKELVDYKRLLRPDQRHAFGLPFDVGRNLESFC